MSKYITSTPGIMGGASVIKGTRIPVTRIMYLLKEGYPVEAIHDMYNWVEINTLGGAIDEAIEVINTTLHAKRIL